MTFAQLHAFATVARLGSVKAAAHSLGVSEPSVSEHIKGLRRDLGDDLFIRAGGGIRLTPGGSRLAAAAAEILGMADQARRAVREARGEGTLLRVAATASVYEHAAGPLLDAFTRRASSTEATVTVEPGESFADLLVHRLADVTLGPRPRGWEGIGIESVPFLRIRSVVVASPAHPLARRRRIAPAALAGERWLVGAAGAGLETTTGAFFRRHHLAPEEVRAYASDAAAASAAASGRGVMLAVAHTVLDELRRGTLARLDVRETPVEGLWFASTLRPDRRTPAAWALRRFVTTPEATQAMLARPGGVPAERFRPPVFVTLWS